MKTTLKLGWWSAVLGVALATIALSIRSIAQDQDDPPGRVARLGYLQGSVSFPARGRNGLGGAVPNRPMTTGDQLWTDKDSRAEVQLGSAVIRLAPTTGFSFLNLDDDTVQIQLTSGAINIRCDGWATNDDFEIDTPNQAFSVFQPGHYRVEASADGNYTVDQRTRRRRPSHGRRADLRRCTPGREARSAEPTRCTPMSSRFADPTNLITGPRIAITATIFRVRRSICRAMSLVMTISMTMATGATIRTTGTSGFPTRLRPAGLPITTGHWDWISPWGWTWVDDSSWGYAPFHYGRWVSVGGRWGWVAGPVAVQAVYAPALVVFIGGGPGGFGGNVGWFPLGPREVYVPSYHVSQAYVNRVNISNTTVNVTQVTNVYNTTIIHNTTNITNITYANRNVQGAVMVVPQHAFVSAQPVAKVAVTVSARQIAAAPLSARVAVAPTRESVLGAKAATAGHVAAPPAAVANRQVVAKKTPPPPPVPFAKQQQALAAHPGQPLAEKRSTDPASGRECGGAADGEGRRLRRKPRRRPWAIRRQSANRRPARSACGDAGESADESSGHTRRLPAASRSGRSGATESFRPAQRRHNRIGRNPRNRVVRLQRSRCRTIGRKQIIARITTDAEPSGEPIVRPPRHSRIVLQPRARRATCAYRTRARGTTEACGTGAPGSGSPRTGSEGTNSSASRTARAALASACNSKALPPPRSRPKAANARAEKAGGRNRRRKSRTANHSFGAP